MTRKFSQRIGVETEPDTIQLDSMDKPLKNSIWNTLHNTYGHGVGDWRRCVKVAAQHFFKVPVDEIPHIDYQCMEWLKQHVYNMEWYEVYNFIEFIVKYFVLTKKSPGSREAARFITSCNSTFEKELSGYRFISGVLSPISNKEEVSEISEAIEKATIKNLFGTKEHLQTALMLLGKKPEPDYRNSVKEAISAVESIAKQITGSSSQGLSGALNSLSEHTEIHGALKSAFNKLYGYTSNEDGPIKIGYTDGKDAQRRLTSLQVGNVNKLHILATIEGDKSYETELHKRFERLRLNGEWFEPSEILLEYIEHPPRLRQEMLRYKNFFLEETISDLKNQNNELQEDLNKLKKAYQKLIIDYNRLLRAPDKMALELQTFVDENRDLKQEIMILRRKLQNWTPPNLKYTKPLS